MPSISDDSLSRQHRSGTSLQNLEQACASLTRSSHVLTKAGASLSSALLNEQESDRKTRRTKRRATQSRVAPYFRTQLLADATAKQVKAEVHKGKTDVVGTSSLVGPQISPHFVLRSQGTNTTTVDIPAPLDPSLHPFDNPPGLGFELQPAFFGLIQERICGDLYALVVQAILWNKTRGTAARPVLWNLLGKYPTPSALAVANVSDVEDITRKLGLQQRRARRLVDMATVWIASPPTPARRYGRRHYPSKRSNMAVKDRELLDPDDVREGWEIGHLPGVGEYALDSFRIFGRDRLRGLADDPNVEPEWKRLVPSDKELGPYVRWKWALEGWDYQVATGTKKKL
jgi:endonuclease III